MSKTTSTIKIDQAKFTAPTYLDNPPEFVPQTPNGRIRSPFRLALESLPVGKWIGTGVIIEQRREGETGAQYSVRSATARAVVSRIYLSITKEDLKNNVHPPRKYSTRMSVDREIFVTRIQ